MFAESTFNELEKEIMMALSRVGEAGRRKELSGDVNWTRRIKDELVAVGRKREFDTRASGCADAN